MVIISIRKYKIPYMVKCNICGGSTKILEAREQMMGLNETFTYNQCIECGHTHLHNIPAKMDTYYDTKQYYSFVKNTTIIFRFLKIIPIYLEKLLILLNVKKSFLYSAALKSLLSIKDLNKNSTILDYGCGAGQFINELKMLGFKKPIGFDPFLTENVVLKGQLVLSNNLSLFTPTCWDIITLNHVFEHLENPVQKLIELNNHLAKHGKLLLRFPVIDSYAFEKYHSKWVQLDAPRHLNLFTRKSIKIAIEKAGNYKIISFYDDSYHFQFTGSELYMKNLSLKEHNNWLKRILSFKTYQFHFLAKKLNSKNKGDQVVIILEKI